jgi:hypothetical protein
MEIIACKLELFKNPTVDFINQEISAEMERFIINRQNYDPRQYGTPSLNSSPAVHYNRFTNWFLFTSVFNTVLFGIHLVRL